MPATPNRPARSSAKKGDNSHSDPVASVVEGISSAMDDAEEWIEGEREGLRDRIRNAPIQSVLIAAAIGAVLSRIFL